MIFDGIGNSFKTKITYADKNEIFGNILSHSYKVTDFIIKLYTSIPKGYRFEWLIEKCAEIGVSEITPINTKRSINTGFSKNKLERYKRISIAASSQCGRNDIMKIDSTIDFKTACKKIVMDKKSKNILSWEKENSPCSLNALLAKPFFHRANILIGPEGGFENEEIEFAKSLGIQTVTLGDNILKIETAAIVTSILILNFFRTYAGTHK
jgi:16S rRNA (uracil1498-N3)-methyltransferase